MISLCVLAEVARLCVLRCERANHLVYCYLPIGPLFPYPRSPAARRPGTRVVKIASFARGVAAAKNSAPEA